MDDNHLLMDYTRGAVAILSRCITLYDGGETVFYRVMAVELRLLLCDTTRLHGARVELSLIPALFPGLLLPPLDPVGRNNPHTEALPIAPWLEQSLALPAGAEITVRELIRRVCDQDGGAHVDRRKHALRTGEIKWAHWVRVVAGVVIDALKPRL